MSTPPSRVGAPLDSPDRARASPPRVRPGAPSPLGATWDGTGTNFAVYSESATGVDVCLFDANDVETRVRLDQRTEFVWHAFVEGVKPGDQYAFRAAGPWEPLAGQRFNYESVLLDPYARATSGLVDWSRGGFSHDVSDPKGDLARNPREQRAAPLGIVIDPAFDWGKDAPPNTPMRRSILYETHVKGLTMRHPDVPPELRGTYAGVGSEPIVRHLVELGVTAVELLPVHGFVDEPRLLAQGLRNYWGNSSIAFFAPDTRYRAGDRAGDEVRQFKSMVRALHAAGIEVILDVVYTPTAEGNHLGPALSLKGIDNQTYYRLAKDNPRFYFDYTGSGNTLNVRHPQTLRLIMDSLRYWVAEMHVDGFRFDLASTLARSLKEVDRLSSFFAVMNQEPLLANVKLIAEPWDMGEGGYQVGHFPLRWSEWNAEYRNAMRSFWRGDPGRAAEIGARLTGSADLYRKEGRAPSASVNFVTAHDGFTLRDLVSYERKHNEANGEGNADGTDTNLSSNGGFEGETGDAAVNAYRARQQRNLLATLLLSRGTPMISGGDEIGRTQRGNNNAYCQDNQTSWYDWDLDDDRRGLLAFTRALVRIRRAHPRFHAGAFASGDVIAGLGARDVEWFRHDGRPMTGQDWANDATASLGLYISGFGDGAAEEEGRDEVDDDLFLVLNASPVDLSFVVPALHERGRGTRWTLLVDTADERSGDEVPAGGATPVLARSLKLFARRALSPAGLDAFSGAATSSYRLQLEPKFGFRDALAIAQYLDDLGAGAVYSSPILKARSGSTHGYDVVDHAQLNPDLGTRDDFEAWTSELARRGLRYVLDFVPNHMGVGGGENAFWNDVLENGPSALSADLFDIDWDPPTGALKGKLLLPVLGGQFGEELEGKNVKIVRHGGILTVEHGGSRFPASPRSYRSVLEPALGRLSLPRTDAAAEELESITTSIRHLPLAGTTLAEERSARARETDVMKRRLRALVETSEEVAGAVEATIAELNENVEKLEAFLLDQNFRLASWRVAGDEINYRRFFDLNDLAAVRMEDPRVFAHAHRYLFELIAARRVTGVRLDHTDGLYDPAAYFAALRAGARHALAGVQAASGEQPPLYVLAEKILAADEELPGSWAIAGTTGYDYLAVSNGLWVDPSAAAAFDALFVELAGGVSYDASVHASKGAILRSAVSSEVHLLAHLLKRIADGRRRARDFTLTSLLHAVEETLRAFPVYRTYVRPDGSRQPNDEACVRRAIDAAMEQNPLIDDSVFDFLRSILLLEDKSEESVRFAMRFQQLTGPVAAKGIEDTATYRYVRLVSNNEVGCDPSRFATSPEELHAHNAAKLARSPLAMTATTTHDTKKSEDVRARLAVLSEIPDEWRAAAVRWNAAVARYTTHLVGGPAPSRLDEYLFFQVMVGAFPHEGLTPQTRQAFGERMAAYMAKAAHEAKLRTSWLAPDRGYDEALRRFVHAAIADDAFVADVADLVRSILPHAASNSLAQTALRLGAPGVPDVYQGTELWDLSLVDPDNRRAVDYSRRREMLARLASTPVSRALAEELVSSYADGRIKMHVTRTALRMRREEPALFLEGAYEPVASASLHIVAFARMCGPARLVVVVPRLTRRLLGKPGFALGDVWRDETLDVGTEAIWEKAFTGERLRGRELNVSDVFRAFPVAWLRAVPS